VDVESAIKIVKEYGCILREELIKNVQGRFMSTIAIR